MTVDELKTEMDRGFADVRQQFVVVHADLHVLKEDVAVLKDDVAVLKDDVAVLKDDVAGLKEDVGVLKEDVGVLKTDVTGVKGELLSLREQVAEEARATRRHMDVLFEAFKAENRVALEQLQPLRDASGANVDQHTTFVRILDDHEVRIGALEQKRSGRG